MCFQCLLCAGSISSGAGNNDAEDGKRGLNFVGILGGRVGGGRLENGLIDENKRLRYINVDWRIGGLEIENERDL